MKVAVIYPEVLSMARYREKRKEFPPFGALYIAASIEAHGHDVSIIKLDSANLTPDLSSFDVVAFSISASATFNMFLECRTKSRFNPNVFLVAGGVHANLFPEQTLIDLIVDIVAIGEGEDLVVELIEQSQTRDFSKISGVCFQQNGIIYRTPRRMTANNIDRFLLPARHLIPIDDFIMNDRLSNTNLRLAHVMPGRGCPFPCRYCASAQTNVQYRSGSSIRQELMHLIDTYDIQGFAVVGNDFILNNRNVYDICASIDDLDLKWATLSRVDRINPDILKVMHKAGCYEIEFGVESGSQRILDTMDKRVTVEQIKAALRQSHEAGIHNKIFIVHGYPGEDMDSVADTIALLEDIGQWIDRVSLFRFVPLPGTYVYNNAEQFRLHGTDKNSDWDGDWGKYHIHHNHHHWWGTDIEFKNLTQSYWELRAYVESRWPSHFALEELPDDQWQNLRHQLARSTTYKDGNFTIINISTTVKNL